MFLSIFAATCRPDNIVGFLDNLAETASDLTSFEVLLKIDEGADDMVRVLDNYKKTAKFSIKYIASAKLDGYYTLEVGYSELLKIAHPDTYFCWLLTDEIRLQTKGWDSVLKEYIGFYPDDIFRLKLSIFQLKNYYDFFECLPCPDNYAVTTRKWLEITEGWGHFWGPDSWHQCVDYYLGLCTNQYEPHGIWRSVPVLTIKVAGQEAGQGITDTHRMRERAVKIWHGWQKHSTHAAQENFHRLAQRLNAHIYAHAMDIPQYIIRENHHKKNISLYGVDEKKPYKTSCYKVPRLRVKCFVGNKKANFWHVFPMLYCFRQSLIDYYRLLAIIKNRYTYDVYVLLNRLHNDIDRFFAACIKLILSSPVYIAKLIYQHLISRFITLPTQTLKRIHLILSLPLIMSEKLWEKCKTLIETTLQMISSHQGSFLKIVNWALRIERRSQRNTVSFLFDGKYLTAIECEDKQH